MRRALLLGLAALAAPVVAAAQTTTAPAITFTEGSTDITHGKWISLAECLASKNAPASDAAKVNLSWVLSTYPNGGSYKLFASTATITTATCPDTGGTNPVFEAGQVGAALGNLGPSVNLLSVKFADIFAAVKVTDCATVTSDKPIYVCAQAYDSGGTAVATAGIATGTITLSTTAPGAPPFASAVPADDGALKISWGRPDSSPPAYDYVVTATGRATDTTPHSTGDIVALEYIMKGLVNGETYDITVVARSAAGNPGPAATTSATAVPVANFWDVYHDPPPDGFGGQEQGGCSAGAAGPVALLGVAALLAALRRRK